MDAQTIFWTDRALFDRDLSTLIETAKTTADSTSAFHPTITTAFNPPAKGLKTTHSTFEEYSSRNEYTRHLPSPRTVQLNPEPHVSSKTRSFPHDNRAHYNSPPTTLPPPTFTKRAKPQHTLPNPDDPRPWEPRENEVPSNQIQKKTSRDIAGLSLDSDSGERVEKLPPPAHQGRYEVFHLMRMGGMDK